VESSRISAQSGGICVLVDKALTYQQLVIRTNTYQCIGIKVCNAVTSYNVIAVYRQPDFAKLEFFKEFHDMLKKFLSRQSILVVYGDVNIRIDRQYELNTMHLVDKLFSVNVSQLIDVETQINGGTIDHVITRCKIENLSLDFPDPEISDHAVITCELSDQLDYQQVRTTSCSLSISLSVRLSHATIIYKRLNLS